MSEQEVFLLLDERNRIENLIFDEELASHHRDYRNYYEERNFQIQKAKIINGRIPFRVGEVFKEHSTSSGSRHCPPQ